MKKKLYGKVSMTDYTLAETETYVLTVSKILTILFRVMLVFLIIFRHIIYNMGGKSSTQMVRFLPDVCQLRSLNHRWTLTFGKNVLKPLKCSSGHVECSFDNLAKNFLPKVNVFRSKTGKYLWNNYIFRTPRRNHIFFG